MLLLNTEQRVWILRTMWYFSFSFLINLQKCQQFCVFLSIWGAVCTLMRKKMNLNDFSKWLQYNKSEKFKGVWILSVPTVYIYIYIYIYIHIVTSLYVTLSCCLSIFLFLVFFFQVCLFFLLAALSFFFSLSFTFTFAGGVRIGRLACQSFGTSWLGVMTWGGECSSIALADWRPAVL